jgi:hypothetical protein
VNGGGKPVRLRVCTPSSAACKNQAEAALYRVGQDMLKYFYEKLRKSRKQEGPTGLPDAKSFHLQQVCCGEARGNSLVAEVKKRGLPPMFASGAQSNLE